MVSEHRGVRTNLRILEGSRKKPRVGDLFVLHIASEVYVFGRVVRDDALWTLIDPEYRSEDHRANLVYIYDHVSPSGEVPDFSKLQPSRLLIPPLFVDRLWWSRGYFQALGNYPFSEGDVLTVHCFKNAFNRRYYDEYNNELPGPFEPVGHLALPNIGWIDVKLSRALGIAEVEEES